ncbi:hypothetical protein [Clostridium sp. C2-6-12]|uniref:hypothetical protein n=1 Tax=Clostridium sp. C2-6-12 TaxID=2698832 RepID=UPI00137071CA|nr:hypothetical protein [Clostridium sp. C2-6-12]
MKNVYVVEGKNIYDLNSLFNEFVKAVNAPNGYLGSGLLAFDEIVNSIQSVTKRARLGWRVD